jgi:hypothetical protein
MQRAGLRAQAARLARAGSLLASVWVARVVALRAQAQAASREQPLPAKQRAEQLAQPARMAAQAPAALWR